MQEELFSVYRSHGLSRNAASIEVLSPCGTPVKRSSF
jgi:hypothetical protein